MRKIISLLFLSVFVSACVQNLFYIPKTDGKQLRRVLLVGDSILDNHYWNGVGANTTGEELRKILKKYNSPLIVDDRSAEEASSVSFKKTIDSDGQLKVNKLFAINRSNLESPMIPKKTERILKQHVSEITIKKILMLCMFKSRKKSMQSMFL